MIEGLYLLGAIALVLVNGFFVAAEFALVRLRQTRVKGIERRFGLRLNTCGSHCRSARCGGSR